MLLNIPSAGGKKNSTATRGIQQGLALPYRTSKMKTDVLKLQRMMWETCGKLVESAKKPVVIISQ